MKTPRSSAVPCRMSERDDPSTTLSTHIARTSPEYDDGGARAMWDFSINTTYTPYSDAIDAVEISRVGR